MLRNNSFYFIRKLFQDNLKKQISIYLQRNRHSTSKNINQNIIETNQFESEDQCTQKVLKVSIIGMPNAGKSTFINSLTYHQVCPTSNKVHTTREMSRALFTEENTQIIFLDTPGIVSQRDCKKYQLDRSFLQDSNKTMKEADIVGVIHDVSNQWTRDYLDNKILSLLEKHGNLASFLVLNKIDVLKSKRKLLDLTQTLTENCLMGRSVSSNLIESKSKDSKTWRHFSEVFMVSALTGDGITDVKEYLLSMAQPSHWLYNTDDNTDQRSEKLIVNIVRATLLDFLPQEIPYSLKSELEFFEPDKEGYLNAVVMVTCPSERIKKLVSGVGDGKLKQITASAQNKLWKAFREPIMLRIVVSSEKT